MAEKSQTQKENLTVVDLLELSLNTPETSSEILSEVLEEGSMEITFKMQVSIPTDVPYRVLTPALTIKGRVTPENKDAFIVGAFKATYKDFLEKLINYWAARTKKAGV